MSNASSVAAIVVAVVALMLVIRWPRPRTDRRALQRRAHSLATLAVVVSRSTHTTPPTPHQPTDPDTPTDPLAPAAPQRSVTVLGPCQPTPPNDADVPRRAHRQVRSGTRASVGRHHALPRTGSTGEPSLPSGHTAIPVVRLETVELPADTQLAESTDALHPVASPPPAAHPRPLRRQGHQRRPQPAPSPLGVPRWSQPRRLRARTVARRAAALVAVATVGALSVTGFRLGGDPSTPSVGEVALAEPAVPALSPPAAPDPPALLAPSASDGDLVTFLVATPLTLDLAAGAPAWVRVQSVEGAVLFEATLGPGESASVPATGPLVVRLGNAGGVLVAADGQLLDHPRTAGEPLTLAIG